MRNDPSRNSSFSPAASFTAFLEASNCIHLKSLLHNDVTNHVETYTTVLQRISQDLELHRKLRASSLEPHGCKDSEHSGSRWHGLCARSVMVHSAMAFLADDKTLGALGQASRLIPATKHSLDR